MKRDNKGRPAFTRRALLIGTAQAGVFTFIGGRLYNLQVAQHGKYAMLAAQNSISERLTAPERGLITDRFGTIVAGNQQHWRALFMQTPYWIIFPNWCRCPRTNAPASPPTSPTAPATSRSC
jgi:penicillin-binding protein 2